MNRRGERSVHAIRGGELPIRISAMARFGVSGNILAAVNVASITDGGAGVATVGFDRNLSTSDYTATVSVMASAARFCRFSSLAIASLTVGVEDSAGVAADPTFYNVMVMEKQ